MEKPNRITDKDLKKQFNILGLAFILMTGFFIAAYLGYEAILSNNPALIEGYNRVAIDAAAEALIISLAVLLPFFAARKLLKIQLKDVMGPVRIRLSSILSSASMGIALYLFFTFITNSIYYSFNPAMESITALNPAFTSNEWLVQVLYSLYFILILPFVEEYGFRGIVLRCTSSVGGLFGMLSSSFLYALCFLGQGNILVYFITGIFLSILSMVYHSIWPAYFVHLAINLIIVFGIFVPAELSWLLGIITVIVYAVSIYALFHSSAKKLVLKQSIPMKMAWKCFFTSWLMFFAIILLIFLGVYYILI